jgi:ketosteroid isomerase-like protein
MWRWRRSEAQHEHVPGNGEALTAAFDSRDLERLIGLLDERVIWRGLPGDDHEDDGHDPGDDHDHGPPVCTDRDQVREVFERFLAGGATGHPVVLVEVGDTVVVDPQPVPQLPFPLHQSFTFRGDRIVLIQDYPDRAMALADVGA